MDLNKIIKIQKYFLLKKIIKIINTSNLFIELNKFKNLEIHLFDKDKYEEKCFSEIKNILLNTDNIKFVKLLLNYLYRYKKPIIKISATHFLTAWLIICFPKFILGKTKEDLKQNEYPNDIYESANKLINNIYKINNNFFYLLHRYSILLLYFLERDKLEQITNLIIEFNNINDILEDINVSNKYNNKIECINIINNTKDKIIEQLIKLDNRITIKILEEDYLLNKIQKEIIMEIEFQILFKDILVKDFTILKELLNNINNKLIKLNVKTIDKCFEDNVDINFLIQLLKNVYINKNDIIKYGEYYINIIKQLQTNNNILIINHKWDILQNKNLSTEELLCNIIFFILNEINNIT